MRKLPENLMNTTMAVFSGSILVALSSYMIPPVLIFYSGTAAYTSYSLLYSFVALITLFSGLGIGITAQRYLPSASLPKERQRLFYKQFWPQLFLLVFGASITVIFAFIKGYLGVDKRIIIQCLLLFVASFTFSQMTIYFRYTNRPKQCVILTILQPYSFLLIYFCIGFLGSSTPDFPLLLKILNISYAIAILIGAPTFLKEISISFIGIKFHWLKQEISTGFPFAFAAFIEILLGFVDRIIISAFLGLEAAGSYIVSFLIASIPLMLPKLVNVAVKPTLSIFLDSGRTQDVIYLLKKCARLFLFLCLPFVFGLLILSESFFELYVGKTIAQDANILAPILGIGVIFLGLGLIRSNIFFLTLKTKELMFVSVISLAINATLNCVAILVFDSLSLAAASTSFSLFVHYLMMCFFTEQRFSYQSLEVGDALSLLSCLAPTFLVIYFCAKLVNPETLYEFLLVVFFASITFLASVRLDRRLYTEWLSLIRFLKQDQLGCSEEK